MITVLFSLHLWYTRQRNFFLFHAIEVLIMADVRNKNCTFRYSINFLSSLYPFKFLRNRKDFYWVAYNLFLNWIDISFYFECWPIHTISKEFFIYVIPFILKRISEPCTHYNVKIASLIWRLLEREKLKISLVL